jgi:hypothetical protein
MQAFSFARFLARERSKKLANRLLSASPENALAFAIAMHERVSWGYDQALADHWAAAVCALKAQQHTDRNFLRGEIGARPAPQTAPRRRHPAT